MAADLSAETRDGVAEITRKTLVDRYPGARSFDDSEIDSDLFFGRSAEISEAVDKVRSVRLVVLYGHSGLGKTSLLQAGVFPRLRRRHYLPLKVRINRRDVSPIVLLKDAVKDACGAQGIDYEPGSGESWWEFFKTASFWRGQEWLTPVLVLDQFEEIFTLQNRERRREIAAELGALVIDRMPGHLRQKLRAGEVLDFDERPPELKVILSLREEYVGSLQELFPEVPTILKDRIRLEPMRREQAEEAVVLPGKDARRQFRSPRLEYHDDALARLLDFLTNRSGEIEPFQLQVLCQNLEKRATAFGARETVQIDSSFLGTDEEMQGVLQNFYQDAIAGLPTWNKRREARRLCEFGLLSKDGYRESLGERTILRDFGLEKADLDALVDSRLLRREPQLDSYSYELTHDSLATSVAKNRPLRLSRRAQFNIAAAIAFVLIAATGFSWQQYLTAVEAQIQARTAYEQAEEERVKAIDAQMAERLRADETSTRFQSLLTETEELRAERAGLVEELKQLSAPASSIQARIDELESFISRLQEQLADAGSNPGANPKTVPDTVELSGGSFMLGSGSKYHHEWPQLAVTVGPFAIGKYEVTFEQYDTFALATGRPLPDDEGRGRGTLPVFNVSWDNAREYARWLSQQTRSNYRLPTEAEWEYAARAGTGTSYWWGQTFQQNQSNCKNCLDSLAEAKPRPVGSFTPNAFGLFDTSGNVWEWVDECWSETLGQSTDNCARRVIRGGSWDFGPEAATSTSRDWFNTTEGYRNIGFRIVRELL